MSLNGDIGTPGANTWRLAGSYKDAARADHRRTFRTDIERLNDGHLPRVPLDVLRSTNNQAVFRGAVTKGAHTATDESLARFLESRLATDDIHLDLSVTIER